MAVHEDGAGFTKYRNQVIRFLRTRSCLLALQGLQEHYKELSVGLLTAMHELTLSPVYSQYSQASS